MSEAHFLLGAFVQSPCSQAGYFRRLPLCRRNRIERLECRLRLLSFKQRQDPAVGGQATLKVLQFLIAWTLRSGGRDLPTNCLEQTYFLEQQSPTRDLAVCGPEPCTRNILAGSNLR